MKVIEQKDLKVLSHKDLVRFALFCAYQVKITWENIPKCMEAIRLTELWLEGKAAAKECRDAAIPTSYITSHAPDITVYAAYATYATYAASTAFAATHAVNASKDKDRVIQEQWKYYTELRDFDKIAEQILIGG
jgi:hypothetical protein